MSAKFTIGEWFCNGRLISSEGEFIATVSDTDKPWPEVQANAHLIAVAPEMYEMLEKARDTMLNTYDTTEWPANGLTECDVCANEIDKLLAKARGE